MPQSKSFLALKSLTDLLCPALQGPDKDRLPRCVVGPAPIHNYVSLSQNKQQNPARNKKEGRKGERGKRKKERTEGKEGKEGREGRRKEKGKKKSLLGHRRETGLSVSCLWRGGGRILRNTALVFHSKASQCLPRTKGSSPEPKETGRQSGCSLILIRISAL